MVVAGCRMCHVCVVRPRVRTVTSTSFLYNVLLRHECKKRNKPETDTHRYQMHAVTSEGKLVSFSNRAVQQYRSPNDLDHPSLEPAVTHLEYSERLLGPRPDRSAWPTCASAWWRLRGNRPRARSRRDDLRKNECDSEPHSSWQPAFLSDAPQPRPFAPRQWSSLCSTYWP